MFSFLLLPCVALAAFYLADFVLAVGEGTQQGDMISHEIHKNLECKTSHHKMDTPVVLPCYDSECHDNFSSKKGDDSVYKAFHNSKTEVSCIDCHRKMKMAVNSCKECHKDKGVNGERKN